MRTEFYDVRIQSIQQAASRNRWVLSAVVVASIATIGSTWNYAFVQFRSLFLQPYEGIGTGFLLDLQRELAKNWIETLFVNIPLLGIRFPASEASLIGGFALGIVSLWLYYCLKVENHLVGQTLRDAISETKELRAYVFHGILGAQVFSSYYKTDAPIASIRETPQNAKHKFVSWVSSALNFLPLAAQVFLLCTDVLTIVGWLPSAFRAGSEPPPLTAGLFARGLFGAAICVFISFQCWRADQYERATRHLLEEVAHDGWGEVKPIQPAAD